MAEHYPVGLVGEQFCQSCISSTKVGEVVDVFLESGNPHDDFAIVVRSRGSKSGRLGYVPKDSFLHRVFHEQNQSVAAAITKLERGQRGFVQVVMLVSILDEPPEQVYYRP